MSKRVPNKPGSPCISVRLVGENIRKIRGSLTQNQFKDAVGIKYQSYVSRYERDRVPEYQILVNISRFGNTTVDALLGV